ncbi:hypothetical protein Tco_0986843 [Tanacetum coccineum]
MITKAMSSDDRMSQLFTQLQSQRESGSGSGSGAGEDDESEDDESGDDEDADEDVEDADNADSVHPFIPIDGILELPYRCGGKEIVPACII